MLSIPASHQNHGALALDRLIKERFNRQAPHASPLP